MIEELALKFVETFGDAEDKAGAEVVETGRAMLATTQGQAFWNAVQVFEKAFVGGQVVIVPAHRVIPSAADGHFEMTQGGGYRWVTGDQIK